MAWVCAPWLSVSRLDVPTVFFAPTALLPAPMTKRHAGQVSRWALAQYQPAIAVANLNTDPPQHGRAAELRLRLMAPLL
jgi:hypothetical protein